VGRRSKYPEQFRQRAGLAGVLGAVVDDRPQRIEAEAALERRRGGFLLRVGGDQGGVYVDDQRRGRVPAVVGGVLTGQRSAYRRIDLRCAYLLLTSLNAPGSL
jgi:hypothetical protein